MSNNELEDRTVNLRGMDNERVLLSMRLLLAAIAFGNDKKLTAGEMWMASENIAELLKVYCDPEVPCFEFIKKLMVVLND